MLHGSIVQYLMQFIENGNVQHGRLVLHLVIIGLDCSRTLYRSDHLKYYDRYNAVNLLSSDSLQSYNLKKILSFLGDGL